MDVRDAQGNGLPELEGRQKRLSVLAYLGAALPYGFHRRDKLFGLFWAEKDQAQARKALNQSLLIIRDALGDKDAILSRGDAEVAINPELIRVDVREFDAAMERGDYDAALDLYQGDLLDGCYVADAPEFERWAEQERNRLRHAALKAAFTLVEKLERTGAYEAAVERSRWAARMAPLDEGVFRQYLELLDRHGDRSTALKEYTEFVERLDDDYGVDPSPETQALVARIRSRAAPRTEAEERPAGAAASRPEPVAPAGEDLLATLRLSLAGKYDVSHEIGRGGMALVFRGRDLARGRDVAIKALKPELVQSLAADRFLQEIRVEAAVEHPNVIAIHDAGMAGGIPYYVMPLFEGESLRARLKRERQLPIEDALRITGQVASALQAAHQRGYVHRDVKPDNILLEGGRAVVSDFGVARALAEAGATQMTVTGVAVGTPAYMSPEQATGDPVDARSDQYALACVLYEMLTGEMPFSGSTARSIIAKHVSTPAGPVSALRPSAGRWDRAVQRALSKIPADRYASVSDFAAALRAAAETGEASSGAGEGAAHEPRAARPPRRIGRYWPAFAALALAVAGVTWAASRGGTPAPDPSRYAVLPLDDPGRLVVDSDLRLFDAVSRWTDISVIDPLVARGAFEERITGRAYVDAARETARALGAGRYVMGAAFSLDGVPYVRATLVLTGRGTPVTSHTVAVSGGRDRVLNAFTLLVDSLLFDGAPPARDAGRLGTTRLDAMRAYLAGHRHLARWDLDSAEAAFAAAQGRDPSFAEAHAWLAVTRSWQEKEPARWRVDAEQAALGRGALWSRDQLVVDAIVAAANDDAGRACATWDSLTRVFPRDYTGWLGSARCLTSDDVVVADRSSPSGWSFRSSRHRALQHYRRAFELNPSILSGFRQESFGALRGLFMTGGNEFRMGRGDGASFVASPAWVGDTLSFVPHLLESARGFQFIERPAERELATQHLREEFRRIAVAWTERRPESADAREALGVALVMLGDRAGLDAITAARRLADADETRFRIASSEVWMRLAFGFPEQPDQVERVRALADSLLSGPDSLLESFASIASGLANLTGRAHLAARLASTQMGARRLGVPPVLRLTAPALLTYAAIGGPGDSLLALERRVDEVISAAVLPQDQLATRLEWLARPASLAFPGVALRSIQADWARQDFIVGLQAALLRGDSAGVITSLAQIKRSRTGMRPATLTPDGVLPEAVLYVQIGDIDGALDLLDPVLNALPQAAPRVLANPAPAASLVRLAILRAEIAWRRGDAPTARKWANAVVTLWSGADGFLDPTVRPLRAYLSRGDRPGVAEPNGG